MTTGEEKRCTQATLVSERHKTMTALDTSIRCITREAHLTSYASQQGRGPPHEFCIA